mgnify:CR=1 FL=1
MSIITAIHNNDLKYFKKEFSKGCNDTNIIVKKCAKYARFDMVYHIIESGAIINNSNKLIKMIFYDILDNNLNKVPMYSWYYTYEPREHTVETDKLLKDILWIFVKNLRMNIEKIFYVSCKRGYYDVASHISNNFALEKFHYESILSETINFKNREIIELLLDNSSDDTKLLAIKKIVYYGYYKVLDMILSKNINYRKFVEESSYLNNSIQLIYIYEKYNILNNIIYDTKLSKNIEDCNDMEIKKFFINKFLSTMKTDISNMIN